MFNHFRAAVHPWLIQTLGRDRLEYLASNTMNVVTAKLDPFIWSYDCKASIVDIIQETPDTKTFVLLPNQHFKQPLPGQHIEIALDPKSHNPNAWRLSAETRRYYSLSAINRDTVAITVKHKPKGEMSSWLHQHALIGDVFRVSSPSGGFVYRQQAKLLFICAGSGITPAFSILTALAGQGTGPKNTPDIAMYYRSKTSKETIFQQALEQQSLAAVTFSYSGHEQTATGNWQAAELRATYPDIKERSIYLCGPESFKKAVITELEAIDYDFSLLEIENFTRAENNSSESRAFDQNVTVTLRSRNVSFVIAAKDCDKTILESAEQQGVALEHGCRSGMCGSCKTHLISGAVSGNQLGKVIYPCTSYPASAALVLE